MAQIILKYNLKPGVTHAEFQDWVRTTDYPAMRGLDSVSSFKTYQAKSLLMGEGAPSVEYIEIFEIKDMDAFVSTDMPGKTVQSIMGQFMGFADAPEFIVCEEVE